MKRTFLVSKRILLALAVLVVVAVTVAALWPKVPPPIINPFGIDHYLLAGATRDGQPLPPPITWRLAALLPGTWSNLTKRIPGPRPVPANFGPKPGTPGLVVWFRRLETTNTFWWKAPSFTAMLADDNGVEAGERAVSVFSADRNWCYVTFPLVPRRSRFLRLRLTGAYDKRGGLSFGDDPVVKFEEGQAVKLTNPFHQRYPQWRPAPVVPAMIESGGFQVRLVTFKLSTVDWSKLDGFSGPAPPGVRCTLASIVRYSGEEQWSLLDTEVSDATGNLIHLGGPGWNSTTVGSAPIQWDYQGQYGFGSLWPGEDAWRIKLEFQQAAAPAKTCAVEFLVRPPAQGTTQVSRQQ